MFLFVINTYETYTKAPDEIKRLLPSLYWEHFEVTNLAVEFIPIVAGKSKPKVAPKTQKFRRIAETFDVAPNKPSAVIRYRLGRLSGIGVKSLGFLFALHMLRTQET